jgi:ABC-2 type transport system ATP-binding protein
VYGGPEVLVLDDPTSGQGSDSRDALWDAVQRLREDGSTVLLTDPHPDEVQQRADRIGLLHEGALRRAAARLHRLLVWAHDNGVQLLQPRADPPRFDDALRGSDGT